MTRYLFREKVKVPREMGWTFCIKCSSEFGAGEGSSFTEDTTFFLSCGVSIKAASCTVPRLVRKPGRKDGEKERSLLWTEGRDLS